MRSAFDFGNFRRSSVGFDRLFDMLENSNFGGESYPPVDLIKLDDNRYRIEVAVAGFGSFNAQVAEVSIEQGRVRVHRVVCAVDCGRVINPTGVIQQAQGAMVYGLSAALRGNITIDRGRVAESNFHQYEPLRMHEMPVVDVQIVASTAAPGVRSCGFRESPP